MKTVILLKILEKYPLFTANELCKITNKSPEYSKNVLFRLNRQGFIKRIEKGKYTVHNDALIFASYLMTPSYFSLWTALRYYNMTGQQPVSIFVMAPRSKKAIKFSNAMIIFISTKHMFGYKKERYMDFDIFIAEREKAIIDALLYKIPIQDIIRALDDKEINFERLLEYAKKTKNKSLIKRLGFLLEHKKKNILGLKAMDNNYIKLDYLGKKEGKKNKKWKVVVNTGT